MAIKVNVAYIKGSKKKLEARGRETKPKTIDNIVVSYFFLLWIVPHHQNYCNCGMISIKFYTSSTIFVMYCVENEYHVGSSFCPNHIASYVYKKYIVLHRSSCLLMVWFCLGLGFFFFFFRFFELFIQDLFSKILFLVNFRKSSFGRNSFQQLVEKNWKFLFPSNYIAPTLIGLDLSNKSNRIIKGLDKNSHNPSAIHPFDQFSTKHCFKTRMRRGVNLETLRCKLFG